MLARSLLARVAPARRLDFSAAALAWLAARGYPGNIRELRNLVERASLLADGPLIEVEHLLADEPEPAAARPAPGVLPEGELVTLAEAERAYLRRVAAAYPGDRRALAAVLGVSERTLFRKLRDAGL
jgi:DNA-binding NtrC family response regulator